MFDTSMYAALRRATWAIVPLSTFIIPMAAHAQTSTLDWGAGDATSIDGNVTNIYDIGGGKVEIDFTNPDNFVSGTPRISDFLNGTGSISDQTVHLQINPPGGLGSVTMNTLFTDFSKPFVNVSFLLHDIDISGGGSWQDLVSLQGIGAGGSTILPTFDILGTSPVQSGAGELKGQSPASNNSALGDVRVSFSKISAFNLIYGDGPDASTNPSSHGIGIGDIEVTSVPEPMSALAVFAVGAIAAGGALKKKQAT
jgi:hypothetical protein